MLLKPPFLLLMVLGLLGCQEAEEASSTENQPEEIPKEMSQKRTVALQNFENLKSEKNREAENALIDLITVMDEEEDFEEVLVMVEEYLGATEFRRQWTSMNFYKARALENLGSRDEAISIYQDLVQNNTGHVARSTPSMRAICRLLWERNQPAANGQVSDREDAFRRLSHFLKLTKPIVPKFSEKERQDWEALSSSLSDYQPKD